MSEAARLYVWVALGGALGSVARYATGSLAQARWGEGFPWGTLAVNLVGAGLMGVLAGALAGRASPWALFLGTGVLGGFTTYSAFNQEVLNLALRGEAGRAALYAGATVVGALLCGFAGFALGKALTA